MDLLVTYAKCDTDGNITLVGFYRDVNDWWNPIVRTQLTEGGSRSWCGFAIQTANPYHQPERWIERAS